MRLKQEIRHVDPPNSLVLSNSLTGNIEEIIANKPHDKISPETLSHRLQRGWQHLEESPDPFLNNNNNQPPDTDNVPDEGIGPDSVDAPLPDEGDEEEEEDREMSSDSSVSSDDEGDSSASFGDTSPLIDVSSLANTDVDDMSDDDTSTSSSSSEGFEEHDDDELNNNDEGDEDDPAWHATSTTPPPCTSCSPPSEPSGSQGVLPDVLQVGTAPAACEPACSLGADADGSEQGCCLLEITARPDVHLDIRLFPESKPVSIHGNTYPRDARNKRVYSKARDINAWVVSDSFDEHRDEGISKYCGLGEGIRLNNFTILNGQKTLGLTELPDGETVVSRVKQDSVPKNSSHATNSYNVVTTENRLKQDSVSKNSSHATNSYTPTENRVKPDSVSRNNATNSYQNFERNYSKPPANVHMYCKDNWRFKRDPSVAVPKQKPPASEPANKISSSRLKEDLANSSGSPKRTPATDDNSNRLTQAEMAVVVKADEKEKCAYISKVKTKETQVSSPVLYDVYTRESALPFINWAVISKGSRESDWMRKRRNDREEIRRKLAMDSDTEDYISEKLNQHRGSGGSFDRLKNTGNLQICFMNEAAKEDEDVVKETVTSPSTQKPISCIPSSKPATKPTSFSSVTKRQRPKFFFNRPRSWHASKAEEVPEEDLLTRHNRLQAEAREALSQAKDMARMQMHIEKQKKKKSPIVDIVGLPFPDGKNLLTHHALVAMNVAQLQVIVNDLHSQIETLNEDLVKFLLDRDDLHMEQDSMLVDIEDLTRYLGLKGSGNVSSSSSQISVNSSSDCKKTSVRRSQSVHLKSKNLVWPRLPVFNIRG